MKDLNALKIDLINKRIQIQITIIQYYYNIFICKFSEVNIKKRVFEIFDKVKSAGSEMIKNLNISKCLLNKDKLFYKHQETVYGIIFLKILRNFLLS